MANHRWLIQGAARALQLRRRMEEARTRPGADDAFLSENARRSEGLATMLMEGVRFAASAMRVCQARDCPAPFFFARNPNQRFCRLLCAGESIRESKRKWWNAPKQQKKRAKAKAAKAAKKRKRKR